MFPYLIVFAICILLNSISLNKSKIPLVLSCLILSLLAGFRDIGVGTDTVTYSEEYFSAARYVRKLSDISNANEFYDKGYLTLNWIGRFFSDRIWIVFFLTELIITGFTFGAVYRMRKFFHVDLVIFTALFLFFEYNYTYNAMRQLCAVSITLFAFSYLLERKWLHYIGWIIIAVTFHSSAAISLSIPFMYMISELKNKRLRKYLTIFFVASMILSVYSYYQLLIMLGALGAFKESYVNTYGENGSFEGSRVSFSLMIIFVLIYCVIIKSYKNKLLKDSDILLHFLIHTVYAIILFLSLYSIYLYRLGWYFFPISMFYVSVELSKKKTQMYRLVTIFIFAFYWVFNYYIKGNSETIPYTSKILGI